MCMITLNTFWVSSNIARTTWDTWLYLIKVVNQATDNAMTNRIRKKTNNDLQDTTLKTKDYANRTPLKTGINSCAPEWSTGPAPLMTSVVLRLLQTRC